MALIPWPKVMGTQIAVLIGAAAATPFWQVAALERIPLLLLGSSMASAASFVLNQWFEIDLDSRMPRTQNRPLVQGLVSPLAALLLGLFLLLGGLGILWMGVNPAVSMATAMIALLYFLYTPLKQITSWNTFVGALSGAFLPLSGWLAVRPSELDPTIYAMCLMLFAWQYPHAHSIAVLYAQDYRKAGLKMLPAMEGGLKPALWWSYLGSAVMALAALWPFVERRFGFPYAIVAAVGCVVVVRGAVKMLRDPQIENARSLLKWTLILQPLMLTALILDLFLRHL